MNTKQDMPMHQILIKKTTNSSSLDILLITTRAQRRINYRIDINMNQIESRHKRQFYINPI